MCTLGVLSRVLHYAPSPGMGLMGREEKADEAGPEAAYNVSNTWSAMSLDGHIGSVPGPSVSVLTRNSHGVLANGKFLIQMTCLQRDKLLCKMTNIFSLRYKGLKLGVTGRSFQNVISVWCCCC